jgi:hypothetical protein
MSVDDGKVIDVNNGRLGAVLGMEVVVATAGN